MRHRENYFPSADQLSGVDKHNKRFPRGKFFGPDSLSSALKWITSGKISKAEYLLLLFMMMPAAMAPVLVGLYNYEQQQSLASLGIKTDSPVEPVKISAGGTVNSAVNHRSAIGPIAVIKEPAVLKPVNISGAGLFVLAKTLIGGVRLAEPLLNNDKGTRLAFIVQSVNEAGEPMISFGGQLIVVNDFVEMLRAYKVTILKKSCVINQTTVSLNREEKKIIIIDCDFNTPSPGLVDSILARRHGIETNEQMKLAALDYDTAKAVAQSLGSQKNNLVEAEPKTQTQLAASAAIAPKGVDSAKKLLEDKELPKSPINQTYLLIGLAAGVLAVIGRFIAKNTEGGYRKTHIAGTRVNRPHYNRVTGEWGMTNEPLIVKVPVKVWPGSNEAEFEVRDLWSPDPVRSSLLERIFDRFSDMTRVIRLPNGVKLEDREQWIAVNTGGTPARLRYLPGEFFDYMRQFFRNIFDRWGQPNGVQYDVGDSNELLPLN